MPARFVSVDRDTRILLPPDLREWVPEDDLIHFVIAAVARLPPESFSVHHRGNGAKQSPPYLMLASLIYRDANGLPSSRKMELTIEDLKSGVARIPSQLAKPESVLADAGYVNAVDFDHLHLRVGSTMNGAVNAQSRSVDPKEGLNNRRTLPGEISLQRTIYPIFNRFHRLITTSTGKLVPTPAGSWQ